VDPARCAVEDVRRHLIPLSCPARQLIADLVDQLDEGYE
jgi:hypothetical protein